MTLWLDTDLIVFTSLTRPFAAVSLQQPLAYSLAELGINAECSVLKCCLFI